ncbi:MAG: nucleotidyl transferase AbiEii/AbiGii toxin family protein [Mycobacterium sp.]
MNDDERDAVAAQFGVSTEQVERDHLISHLLALISTSVRDQVQFIGGTALARTHLPTGRLSEDIDLIAIDDRKPVAAALDAALPRGLSRSHGRLTLEPALSSIESTLPATLRTASGLSVRIQLLSSRDRIVWPSERRVLVQRYADAPAAELLVPTLPAFAASKTSTWADRKGARDLWDLWALSELGAIDRQATDLYRRYGPTNHPPGSRLFVSAPTDAEWQSQLAGQTRITVSAHHALEAVREAWRAAVTPINDE